MKRNTKLIAVLALSLVLAACGNPTEAAHDPDEVPDSISTAQTEIVRSTDDVAAPARAATTTVEDTTVASSVSEAPTTTTTTSEGSAPTTITTYDISTESAAGSIDQAAVDGLLWMREEEKLARDVYLALSELWDLPIFANIAGSEQAHSDAVGDLLDRYAIADPMAEDAAGVFVDPAIQKLYDDLVEQGSRSVVDALIVGATIEDMDIVDLQLRRSGVEAIDVVYANLEKGSRNHLRAFIRTLESQGGEYTPSFLTTAEYEAIISSPTERGRAGG